MSSFWYLVGRHGIEPCPRCYEQRARTLGPTAHMTPGRAEDGPARACLPGLVQLQETYASFEAWRGFGMHAIRPPRPHAGSGGMKKGGVPCVDPTIPQVIGFLMPISPSPQTITGKVGGDFPDKIPVPPQRRPLAARDLHRCSRHLM